MPELLLAGVVHGVSRLAGAGRIVQLDIEGHGREAPGGEALDSSRTVGWFTTLYPLQVRADVDPATTLREVRERLRAIPNGGHGYGLLRYLSPDAEAREALASLPRAEILFNYLGRADAVLAGSQHFHGARGLALSRSRREQRTHLLEAFGSIEEGRLSLQLAYSEDAHRRSTIEELAAQALETVRTLVREGLGPLAADFPHADLSQSELDDILREYGD